MLLFKLKSQNAYKRCGFCPPQKRWRSISLHLLCDVWRSRRFLEVTGLLPFSSVKALFHFSFFPQPFNISNFYLNYISKCFPWSVASPFSLPPSLQTVLTFFFFFSCSYCWNFFSWLQGRWVNILDDSRPARGKGCASHEVSAQASRKLGRNQWSWSWEYHSHKKQQEESIGIQIQVFRKAAENQDFQNI